MSVELSKLRTRTLVDIAPNALPTYRSEEIGTHKSVLSRQIKDEAEQAGVKELAFMMKSLELKEICDNYLQVEYKKGANVNNKMMLTKRFMESFEETSIEEWVSQCNDVKILSLMASVMGLPDNAKLPKLKEAVQSQIYYYGEQVVLHRLTIDQLRQICDEMGINGCDNTSSKRILIEAISNHEDIPERKPAVVKKTYKKTTIAKATKVQELLQHYTAAQLESWCKKNGLKSSGTKKILSERIIAYNSGDKENTMADQPKARGRKSTAGSKKSTKKTAQPEAEEEDESAEEDDVEEEKPAPKKQVKKAVTKKPAKKTQKKPEPEPEPSEEDEDEEVEEEKPAPKKQVKKAVNKKPAVKKTQKKPEPEPEPEPSEENDDDEEMDEQVEEKPAPKKAVNKKAAKQTKKPEPEPEPSEEQEDDENEPELADEPSYDEAAEKAAIDAERNLRTNDDAEDEESEEDIEMSLSSNFPTDIKGKTFCVTTKGTMTRSKKEIQQAIEKGEGVFSVKLTKHCDYLICDPEFEGNEKTIAAAKKANITVETEDFLTNFY